MPILMWHDGGMRSCECRLVLALTWIFCVHRSIDQYSAGPDSSKLDGIGILQSIGQFILVFVGAFSLGALMGCCTALVSLLDFRFNLSYLG